MSTNKARHFVLWSVLVATGCGRHISDEVTNTHSSHAATEKTELWLKQKPAPPANQLFKIGETVHDGGISYVVRDVATSRNLTDNEYTNQKPNASWLFVHIAIRNNGSRETSLPNFVLYDDYNRIYSPSIYSGLAKNGISLAERINPQVTKDGYLVFDVPQGTAYAITIMQSDGTKSLVGSMLSE